MAVSLLSITNLEAQDIKSNVSFVQTTGSGATGCAGDFNNDGFVGLTDLMWLLGSFGTTNEEEDLTGDGNVAVDDLLAFVALLGSEC